MSDPYVVPGVYYRDAGITLYHGDAEAIVPLLGRVDHVITDPPYDAKTHEGARTERLPGVSPIDFAPLADGDVAALVPLLIGASKRWALAFCALEMFGDYKRAAGEAWVRAGFWRRTNGTPQFTGDRPAQPGEGLAIMHRADARKRWNGHGTPAYWECTVASGPSRVHPTQKPEALLVALVETFTDPGDVILDPFAGSGTTLAACKRLGRAAIGVERSREDCDRIVERLRQGALDLFGRADEPTTGDLLEGSDPP